MVKASMLDGLHMKLLGNGFTRSLQWSLAPPGAFCSRVVTGGNPPGSLPSVQGSAPWKSTPLERTVMPAPSRAPMSEGSCNSSARLPLRLAVQPTAASSGRRSTCGTLACALKSDQPAAQDACQLVGAPSTPRPIKQSRRVRQSPSLPAGCVLALMMLEAAPTPCNRTGFHIMTSSLWAAVVVPVIPAFGRSPAPTPVVQFSVAPAVLQVGSMMSKSPG